MLSPIPKRRPRWPGASGVRGTGNGRSAKGLDLSGTTLPNCRAALPMTDPWCCYGAPWIPSIYPQSMLAYIPAPLDPSWGMNHLYFPKWWSRDQKLNEWGVPPIYLFFEWLIPYVYCPLTNWDVHPGKKKSNIEGVQRWNMEYTVQQIWLVTMVVTSWNLRTI